MKIGTVLIKTAKVYVKNFFDLMGAYLVEGVLRAMCLAPLMFLLLPQTAMLAWLCVPLYVLIALPARQNYALAMQDMLYGGRVLSPRLISVKGYWGKLGRGLLGTLKMLIWMALPIVGFVLLAQVYVGRGGLASWIMSLWGFESLDGITAMRWFVKLGGSTVNGLIRLALVILSTLILPVIGCAVHCGARHAAALEEKKLLRGKRLQLMLLWALGFLVFVPFVAVALTVLLSDLKAFVMGFAEMFLSKSFALPELGEKLYILIGAFVLLFLPMVPFKQLLPAVAAHEQARIAYPQLRVGGGKTDAQA